MYFVHKCAINESLAAFSFQHSTAMACSGSQLVLEELSYIILTCMYYVIYIPGNMYIILTCKMQVYKSDNVLRKPKLINQHSLGKTSQVILEHIHYQHT